jgi:AcrR family transcriptional regulator
MAAAPNPNHDERARLLELITDHILEHGVAQLTLRGLAAAVGSNNRMLLYYFGSKERLAIEGLRNADRRFPLFQTALDELRQPTGDLRATLELAWRAIAHPQTRPHERLFFETFGLAVHRPEVYGSLLSSVSTEWVDHISALIEGEGAPRGEAQLLARQLVSGWRGLEMDLLSERDLLGIDQVAQATIDAVCGQVSERWGPAVR